MQAKRRSLKSRILTLSDARSMTPRRLFAHALSEVRAALNLTDYLDTTFKYGVIPEHRFVLSAGRFDIEALIRSTAQAAATA